MYVLPLAIRHEPIGFSSWLELITLCLAPLVAHIVAGSSKPVYLHDSEPRWHQRICHYNPTSILWRYFAITDRRLRSKNWNSFDMAASNALFWTANGWDGSEDMMARSRRVCTRLPEKHHISLLSGAAIKTAIVAFQGVQAIYYVAVPDASATLVTLFFPVALLGLLRLPPAAWLSEDYSYAGVSTLRTENGPSGKEGQSAIMTQPSLATVLLPTEEDALPNQAYSPGGWRGILVRAGYALFVLALTAFSLSYVIPRHLGFAMTLTNYLQLVFFFVLGAITFTVISFYFCSSNLSTTTVIPCIDLMWYKIYTAFQVFAVLALIAVAAVETRKTSCGVYTTLPRSNDSKLCPN